MSKKKPGKGASKSKKWKPTKLPPGTVSEAPDSNMLAQVQNMDPKKSSAKDPGQEQTTEAAPSSPTETPEHKARVVAGTHQPPAKTDAPPAKTSLPRRKLLGIVSRGNAYHIDPTAIDRRKGWNPRFDFGDIAELALSIKINGVKRPLTVKRVGERFELIDGDRRLTAVEQLMAKGHKFPDGIPAIIEPKHLSEVDAIVTMILGNDGKHFLPLEEAAAYKMLRDQKLTIKQICEKVGRKYDHVSQMLALVEADDSVKDALAKKQIGKQQAKDIATKARGDKTKQRELTSRAVAAKGDVIKKRAVRKEVAAIQRRTQKPKVRRALNLSVTHDYFRTLETRSLVKLQTLMKEMGYAAGTEVKANTKAEKVMLLCGFAAGVRMAQAHNDKQCHENVLALFAMHGLN